MFNFHLEEKYSCIFYKILIILTAMNKIKFVWFKIPQQIRHLFVPVVMIIVFYLIVRQLFVPAGFGQYGHYRGPSVIENATKNVKYAGAVSCADCHEQIIVDKKSGYHRDVACETCHGPSQNHTEDPENIMPHMS